MKVTKPGIYPGFPEADYFADPCPTPSLTQSIAKILLDQSPLHAKTEHPRFAVSGDADEPAEKYSVAKAVGNAAHRLLIGRGKTVAIWKGDDWKKADAREFRDEASGRGDVPILEKHFDQASDMSVVARARLDHFEAPVSDAFVVGAGEVVVACEVDRIWLRSLIDWMVSPQILFDLKTTAMSVAPHVIPSKMADDGWPIQAAMQERVLDILDPKGAGRRRFFFIAQENYKPYQLTVHELGEGPLTMGRKMIARAEAMWREAITTDRWEGYAALIHRPEYPGWKESQWLAREIADEESRPVMSMLNTLQGG